MSLCGRQKGNFKHSQSAATQSGSSMHFWGICCESGKHYNQVVGQRFRVTMAVLEPTSFQNDESERIVSLIVLRDGIEYLLCVLKHGEIHQVSLNLVFDKGENVRFYIKGHGNVYLSGYQLTGSEEDVINDENGYLCPLVEVKTKNKKKKDSISRELQNDDIEMGLEKGKKKSKAGKASLAGTSETATWRKILSESQKDEDDESDEDFTFSDESESDEEDISDEEDVEDELDENELDEDNDMEEDETEIVMNSHGSQKRRKQEKVLPQKRSKKDSFNNSSNSATEDVICIEEEDDDDDDSESESDSDDKNTSSGMKSSFDSMPKSKKQANVEVVSNEKKSKKKKKKNKKLDDVSAISETSANSQNKFLKLNSPVDKSTPCKSGLKPVQKFKGGLIVQDLIVGKGPAATEGKTVHVFYVGRFSDKQIFDSRIPGAGRKPFSFKLGANQVIKGWDLGLVGMRVGGKRNLRIPPKLGYGSQQHPDIPPGSILNFVVELVAVS